MPQGQVADQNANMPAHVLADKKIIEFEMTQDNNELDQNGKP